MMYTICNYAEIRHKQLIHSVPNDSIRDLAIQKIGERGDYPGGEVFMTMKQAETALTSLNVYEINSTPSEYTASNEFRVFGVDPPPYFLYWHRGTVRLKHDTNLLEAYDRSSVRHSFSTELIDADNYEEILNTLSELYPDEPMVQNNLCEWQFLFRQSLTNSPFFDPYRLIISSGPCKEYALAKLRLAG